MPILLLFFCSGATALVYEVIWSKYLALIFGSTVYAQTVVLAVFMGGLALGNRLFGRRADVLKQPLAAYGYLELAIGLYAFFFDGLHRLADVVFTVAGKNFLENAFVLLLWKGVVAVGLLLLPTVLMGGTLPLVAAWLQRRRSDASRWTARFYSINSLGAVTGSFIAGFFLVRSLGLVATLQAAAFVNLFIGATAIIIARKSTSDIATGKLVTETRTLIKKDEAAKKLDPDASLKMSLRLVALTGGVSMGLEVLAARSLVLIFGASLQSFSLVLVAFILGIGFGAAVIASPRYRWVKRELATTVLLLAASVFIGIFMWSVEGWINFYRELRTGLARTAMGYDFQLLLNVLIALVVLGVPAAMLGAVLPLWMRAGGKEHSALGNYVGRLLTWNTVGAVVGVLLTGFLLMPLLGLRMAFGVLAAVLCAGALLLANKLKLQKGFLAGCAVGGFLLFTLVSGGERWQHLMSSGVFRLHETTVDKSYLDRRMQNVKLAYYRDAPDATVSVDSFQQNGEERLTLRINGKTDASSYGDLSTQLMLGHIALLAKPDSKDMFILGLGSGITAGAAALHPLDKLVVAENCRPVIEAAAYFSPWNHGVVTNSRVDIVEEDARTVLKLSPQMYDVICCEPSNPWVAGVGSVFSQEFYQLAASRLKPGGLVIQWFHVYEMHDGILDLVLSTFSSTFPYFEIWDPGSGDILMVGSTTPWQMKPENVNRSLSIPAVKADMASIGLHTPAQLMARQFASQRTSFAIPDSGAIQSDVFPVLEYEAPRAFFFGENATELMRYDERTWQTALAGADKQKILQGLNDSQLLEVFAEARSVNGDVTRYMDERLKTASSSPGVVMREGTHPMPVIFQSYARRKDLLQLPETDVSPVHKALLEAEALIYERPDKWKEGTVALESNLRELCLHQPKEGLHWQPVDFMCLGIRTALAHGDYELAQRIVTLEQYIPENRELRYLKRILQVASAGRSKPKTEAGRR